MSATTQGSINTKSYVAQTSQGLIEYESNGQTFKNSSLVQSDSVTYATPNVGLPATLDAGAPVTETDTEYETDTDSVDGTADFASSGGFFIKVPGNYTLSIAFGFQSQLLTAAATTESFTLT